MAHASSRPSSSPASEVQNTLLRSIACGMDSRIARSSIPRSRRISNPRWLVTWARGVVAVDRYLFTHTVWIP